MSPSTHFLKWPKRFCKQLQMSYLIRFWNMLAHLQGSNLNAAKLASGLDVSSTTILRYVDLIGRFTLRLQPWFVNTGKRLVKSPKVYVRDSGIVNFDDLLSHPVVGISWEGFAIENLLCSAPRSVEAYFYRY